MIPKVLAYITRDGREGLDVLVFRHAHHPEAESRCLVARSNQVKTS
jgi:hypothetical protein